VKYQIQYLGVGGILDQAVKLAKDNFGLLFSVLAVTTIPLSILLGLAQAELMLPQNGSIAQPSVDNPGWIVAAALGGLSAIVVFPLANAAIIHGVASSYLSHPTTMGECLRHGLRRWMPLIWTSFLASFFAGLGFLLLIIPGVILALRYSLSQHVAVLEETNGNAALERSAALMKGNYGSLVGLGLLLWVIATAVDTAATLIPQVHVRVIVNSLIAGAVTVFGTCAWTVFYFSCRCKAENFDLQVLADNMATDIATP
jgi:uncharacterized membrane protein